MKKLIVGLLAMFLTLSGLVALTGSTASAAACPYTGCIKTTTTVKASSPGKKQVKATYRVRAAGNATPKGSVKITLKGKNNGISRTTTRGAVSGTVSFKGLRKGKYSVTAKFIPRANSAFGRSSATTSVRVD